MGEDLARRGAVDESEKLSDVICAGRAGTLRGISP